MHKFLIAAILGLTTATAAVSASAAEDKTWLVYCEGVENGQDVAYMSMDQWTSNDAAAAREIAAMAADMFGAEGRRPLHGCSSIAFNDPALADYRREETVALHARFGTKVEFFEVGTPEIEETTYSFALGSNLTANN